MPESQKPPMEKRELRARFKSAHARNGFEGIVIYLDAAHVACLSCEQATRSLKQLDQEIVRARQEAKESRSDGNNPHDQINSRIGQLQAIEHQVLLGIIANPDMRTEYKRLFDIARKSAAGHVPFIWGPKARRWHIRKNMGEAFADVLEDNPEFAALRRIMHRAADALLEENGLRKLNGFWDERLKSALYPCQKPIEDRIKIRTRHHDGDACVEIDFLKADIIRSLKRIPVFLSNFMDENGYDIRVAERLAHIDRHYAAEALNMAARSHDSSSKGVHVGRSRHIDIPLYNVDAEGELHLASSGHDDTDMTMAHEAFHGIAELMGDIDMNDRDLLEAFSSDLAYLREDGDLSDKRREEISSYLPKSHGGTRESELAARIEAFAEIGAEVSLGFNDNFIGDCFLHTTAYMTHVKDTLEVVYDLCPKGGMLPCPDDLEKRLGRFERLESRRSCFVMK